MRAYLPVTLSLFTFVSSYNILGLFPYPGPSHYIVFDALMVELARRGHNVTVYDHFPKSYPLPNYKQVDLRECFSLPNVLTLDQMISLGTKRLQAWTLLMQFLPSEREILTCQPLHNLRNSTEPYDLLITETFHNDFFVLFGHVLNLPVIVFHTTALLPWMSIHAGIPENPSYVPHLFLQTDHGMSFWNRLENFILYLHSLWFYKIGSEDVYDAVATKFFGTGIPSIGEAVRNASMLFVKSHHTFGGVPRPMVPNAIEIGGINVKPAKSLPKGADLGAIILDLPHLQLAEFGKQADNFMNSAKVLPILQMRRRRHAISSLLG